MTSLPNPGKPIRALACPLCGGPNDCAPALSGTFEGQCWCKEAQFSSELLAQVPAAQQDLACICRNCAAPKAP